MRPKCQRVLRLLCALVVAAGLTSGAGRGATAQSNHTEQDVKAACLWKVAYFVDWPLSALAGRRTFVIGLAAKDPTITALSVLRNKSLRGRPVELRPIAGAPRLGDYHVLFIGRAQKGQLAEIMAAVGKTPCLTMSDIEGFASSGGMVEFAIRKNSPLLLVNHAAAMSAGLTLRSELREAKDLVKVVGAGPVRSPDLRQARLGDAPGALEPGGFPGLLVSPQQPEESEKPWPPTDTPPSSGS